MEEKTGITGSRLKLIAMITMLIDHVGAVIIENGVLQKVVSNSVTSANVSALHAYTNWLMVDRLMRWIGRLAFPIFCFLLIEGFLHTRDWKKYFMRLFVFSLISEIPFNLAIKQEVFYLGYQNVFFTLWIGLLVMAGMRYFEEKNTLSAGIRYLGEAVVAALGMTTAYFLKTDYGWFGVFAIALLYFLRGNKKQQTLGGCLAFCWEITAPLAFIPIYHYNGKRGADFKYVFYIFYPVHLLVLGLLTKFCF